MERLPFYQMFSNPSSWILKGGRQSIYRGRNGARGRGGKISGLGRGNSEKKVVKEKRMERGKRRRGDCLLLPCSADPGDDSDR